MLSGVEAAFDEAEDSSDCTLAIEFNVVWRSEEMRQLLKRIE